MIEHRAQQISDKDESAFIRLITDDSLDYRTQAICTIISEGDAIGSVILCSREEKEKSGDICQKLV